MSASVEKTLQQEGSLLFDKPAVYSIAVRAPIEEIKGLDGFRMVSVPVGARSVTCLVGTVADQKTLLQAINKLHHLNLTLLAVHRLAEIEPASGALSHPKTQANRIAQP